MSSQQMVMAAAGGTAPIAYISSEIAWSNNAGTVVSAPAGIQDGDILIAVAFTQTSGKTMTAPTGFSASFSDNATSNSIWVGTKVAASESGSYTFTWDGTGFKSTVALLVYRNAINLVTVGALTRASASTTSTAASITPALEGALIGVFGTEAVATVSTPPSGMDSREYYGTDLPSLAVYDLLPSGTSASGAKTLTWSAADNTVGIFVHIAQAIPTPSFINYAFTQNVGTGVNLVVNKPTGTADGDLMVALMSANGTTSWSGATGWTEIADQAADAALRVAYKVAGASEPSSYTFTPGNNARQLSGYIVTYRSGSYGAIGTIAANASTLVVTGPSASSDGAVLLGFATRTTSVANSLVPPVGMQTIYADNAADLPESIVVSQIVIAGATGTKSFAEMTTTYSAGVLLTIEPT